MADTDTELAESEIEEEVKDLDIEAESDAADTEAGDTEAVDTAAVVEEEEEEDDEEEDLSTQPYEKVIVKISPDKRMTSIMLTSFEQTELISNRIEQINAGGEKFVDVSDLTDATSMAKRELAARRCPLKIQRTMGKRVDKAKRLIYEYVEEWDPNEMILRLVI